MEQPLPSGLRDPVRHLRDSAVESGIRSLLLWPDRACAKNAETSFGTLWDEVRSRSSADPLEESVIRFAEGLCAYRAGQSGDARDAFEKALDVVAHVEAEDARWALASSAHWSLALALRRTGDLDEAVQRARQAAREARERGAVWLEGAARLALGRSSAMLQANATCRANFDEAHRLLSTAHPADPPAWLMRAHQARLALDAGNAFWRWACCAMRAPASADAGTNGAGAQPDRPGVAHLQLRTLSVARHNGEG